ncbi:hypothetical protein L612_000700000710 [Rhodococcus rhodochrous J38]|uniref:hypothetical protein n=1 Tax=Rhodococcus rhodochrous TaxID=1829 RepID=UPI00119D7926|nr:hypothetical protein [Rhodococcus rhodochrous]TWH37964.1 hypothetical protein L612_000700000710 [Rhodococcus rhodochrous J38]
MHWILWVLLGWAVVSIAAAVILGRIIRARDEREAPAQSWSTFDPADRPVLREPQSPIEGERASVKGTRRRKRGTKRRRYTFTKHVRRMNKP